MPVLGGGHRFGVAASTQVAPGKYEVKMPKRHPAQEKVMREARRFNVMSCGRRWGKTTLGIDLLTVEEGGALDGFPVGWFAPNSKLFVEVWEHALETLRPIARKVDTQQNRIDLVTGGVLDFWTLHNTDDPGRGRKYSRVFIDEAAMVPSHRLEKQWQEAIRPTLTDFRGTAWFASTPKGINYYHELFQRGQDPDHPDWMSWQLPTSTNPFIDPAEIAAAEQDSPRLVFEQEYLGTFVDMSGALVQREWIRVGEPPPRFSRIVMGVDLAISMRDEADYTAVVVMGEHESGVWVLDVVRARVPFHSALNFISGVAHEWKPSIVAIEEVQYQAAVIQELLRTTHLPVVGVRPDRDKLTRFLPLVKRYEQGLVWHSDKVNSEFVHEVVSFPVGEHDDMVDAASYAYNALGYSAAQPRVRSL